MNETYDKLIELLDQHKATYRLIDHAPEGRTEIVSPMRGNELSQAAKCIIMMVKIGKKQTKYVLGVVPGDAKIDLNAVKALFNGTYISFATTEIAEKLAECVTGTVLPFSFNPDLELIVDPLLLKNKEIFFNAARLDRSMALKTSDYKKIANPRIEQIVKCAEPQKTAAKEQKSADVELDHMRHSCAHMLAQAVLEMFPEAKLAIGPTIETGFYYDFDLPRTLIPEDLEILQEKMEKIAREKQTFTRREEPVEEAIKFYKKAGQPYKEELAADLKKAGETTVSFYENRLPEHADKMKNPLTGKPIGKPGELKFCDLCRGGHTEDTSKTGAFKLHKIAGAYWRGDEKRPMLQRIYGLCFHTKAELQNYLKMEEEAKKRDHRKLGQELELFAFSENVGPGLPLWLPNGTVIAEELEKLAKETEFKAGYSRVRTPHITKGTLYHKSGHLPYYKDSMYAPMMIDGEEYYLKPMNCPHHHMCYAAHPKSYRDLPLRYTEYGTCYRYEDSGALFGLMRVRSLKMNDAHIYCTEEQFEQEFIAVAQMYLKYFKLFGIDKYVMRLSLHDKGGLGKKYVNEPELWIKTEDMVRRAMEKAGVPFIEVADEAAFYGPKIDVQVWSAIGREFTLATNQVDFAIPKRFNLTYAAQDGSEQTPLVIHRAPLGTHERFIGFLIEHFGGSFPVWLSPVQVAVLPISDKHLEYAGRVAESLFGQMIRVKMDDAKESLGKKIRNAEMKKIPYILVVGDKEAENGSVAVRDRRTKDQTVMKLPEFESKILEEIKTRSV